MAVKYISKYTGKQIDEAIAAIIENNIQFEDFSPELQEILKSWISANAAKQLVFNYDDLSSAYILSLELSDEMTHNNIYLNKWAIKLINGEKTYYYPVNDMSDFDSIYSNNKLSLKLGTTRLVDNKQLNCYMILQYDAAETRITTDGLVIKKEIFDTEDLESYKIIDGGSSSAD